MYEFISCDHICRISRFKTIHSAKYNNMQDEIHFILEPSLFLYEICTSVRNAAHHADALGTELSLSVTDYETISRAL
jgi:hypothetical protein